MNLIFCIDERNGLLFNHRRLSKDKFLINHICEYTKNATLWISTYSKSLFENSSLKSIKICDDMLQYASRNDFCFIEDISVNVNSISIDKIIIYNWNRKYPADTFFNINLDKYEKVSEKDIIGFSHEKITEKIYLKETTNE